MMLLRELLTGPVEEPPPTADADHFARFRFGAAVADRVIWLVDEDHQVRGVLADDTNTLHLCYEYSEPGSEFISALVKCPVDGRCRKAWGVVESPADLLDVLDGKPHGDPQCPDHDDEAADPDDEAAGLDDEDWDWPTPPGTD